MPSRPSGYLAKPLVFIKYSERVFTAEQLLPVMGDRFDIDVKLFTGLIEVVFKLSRGNCSENINKSRVCIEAISSCF